MDSTDLTKENYQSLVEDIRATLTEHLFQSRWILVEGYWKIGKLISDMPQVTNSLQGLAVDTGIAERTLWYAKRLYDIYPDTSKLPEGKNITWNKLITKYLPETPKENKPIKLCICPTCGNTHKPT